MKKLIGTLVAALLAAAVFAEVGVGAWGRGIWVPFAWDGDAKMAQGVSWGGNGPRVGVSLGGSSDNVGFALDVKGDEGNLGVNDNAFIWVKPWSWLKIQVGQWFDDTLRGGCYFASWDWLRPGNAHADDLTFARIYNTGAGRGMFGAGTYDPMKGVLLALTPVDGLYIAAGFNTGYGAKKFVDVLKTSQYQVGYTIDGIMAIKAQYIGRDAAAIDGKPAGTVTTGKLKPGATPTKVTAAELKYDKNGNAINGNAGDEYYNYTDFDWETKATDPVDPTPAEKGVINAAVDLLMIENNKISVGAYIPLTEKAPIGVAATYNGSFDALSLGAYVAAEINRKEYGITNLYIGVGMGYDLGDGMAIEADVRADLGLPSSKAKDAGCDTKADISVGAYFSKGFSNGKCGIGVIAEFGSWKEWGTETKPGISLLGKNNVSIAIPVKLEYWF